MLLPLTTTLLTLIAAAGLLLRRVPSPVTGVLTVCAIVLAALLRITDPTLWQIVPATIGAVVCASVWIADALQKKDTDAASWKRVARPIGAGVAGAGGLLSLTLLWLFSPVSLPAPTGPRGVGVVEYGLVDSARVEEFGSVAGAPRRLMVRITYPARKQGGVGEYGSPQFFRLFSRAFAEVLAAPPFNLKLPPFLYSHSRIRTHSAWAAQPDTTATPFPVLLFSHGISLGTVNQVTVTAQELASHGYAVVSIAHPYESSVTIFDDGTVATVDIPNTSALFSQVVAVSDLTTQLKQSSDPRVQDSLFAAISQSMPLWHESLDRWIADSRFVIDRLAGIVWGGILEGMLDTARIGALGQSFGGATAGRLCLDDPRVKAGVNWDCHQFGFTLDDTLRTPFLFMYADDNIGVNDPVARRTAGPVYSMAIDGARHFDFSDFALQGPFLRVLGLTGPIDARSCLATISLYTRLFFDTHLSLEEPPRSMPDPAHAGVRFVGGPIVAHMDASGFHEPRTSGAMSP